MAEFDGNSIMIGQSDQELVGSGKKMDIKKIAAFTFIGVIIAGLAITAIVVLIMNDDKNDYNPFFPPPDPAALTLDDVLMGKLATRRFNGTWINDKDILYRNELSDLTILDTSNMNKRIIDVGGEEQAQGVKFDLSSNGEYVLIAKKYQRIFRHGSLAEYDLVNLGTRTITPLKVDDKVVRISLVIWSPVGDSLAFVYENNIYYKSSPDAKEVQITKDGSPTMFNGICDWVYEEEIFGTNTAMHFSPDGTKLAFITFDDSPTRQFNFPIYGVPGDLEDQYPSSVVLNYPKAGTPNPIAHLHSVTLSGEYKIEDMPPPAALASADHLITSLGWANNNSVISIWMNRIQNVAYFQKCEGPNCRVFKNINSTDGWLEFGSIPTVNENGDHIAIITSQEQGTYGGFEHLTLLKTDGAEGDIILTKGRYVVKSIYKWDAPTNLIFYSANLETQPNVLHLYAIKAEADAVAMCITCNIAYEGSSEQHTYFGATFPRHGNNVMLNAQGPGIPRVDLYTWEYTNSRINLRPVLNWELNTDVADYLKDKRAPTIEILDIVLDAQMTARVKLMLPYNLNRTGLVKYPMLVEVYGGPKTNVVIDEFDMDWGSFMASNNVVYAKIDGRGSGLRGDKIMHDIYGKLGTSEIEDQIRTAEKLKQQFSFIDEKRTAIWGWSYGGYASAMTLARDSNNVFQCAASVAPVTDWTYYDSIYTERYMKLPKDNERNYNESRLSTKFEEFRNKKYMLIHGTADDNVHYQQSMAFARTLELNDIMFKEITYPDEDHGLVHVRPHLYHNLGRFFDDCFKTKQ